MRLLQKGWGGKTPTLCITKTRSDPQRVGMCNGERPIGAAKGKQTNTMASCQTPPGITPGAAERDNVYLPVRHFWNLERSK